MPVTEANALALDMWSAEIERSDLRAHAAIARVDLADAKETVDLGDVLLRASERRELVHVVARIERERRAHHCAVAGVLATTAIAVRSRGAHALDLEEADA